jgi:hypothetical protein
LCRKVQFLTRVREVELPRRPVAVVVTLPEHFAFPGLREQSTEPVCDTSPP